jgi:hypothetical protein
LLYGARGSPGFFGFRPGRLFGGSGKPTTNSSTISSIESHFQLVSPGCGKSKGRDGS